MAEAATDTFFPPSSADPKIKYPLDVNYCGVCTMPIEYCEYYPNYDKCKEWLEKVLPTEFEKLMQTKAEDLEADDDKKKRQTRGGKGMMKVKKKAEPQGIQIATSKRSKNKRVTIVTGLSTYDISLKDASKRFANRFSCGASISGEDEIVIQGDCSDDLFEFLKEKWPQIDEDDIEDLGEVKK